MQNSQLSKRLDSLDILRGLDIFFLVALEPLFIWIISKTALAQTAVGGFLKMQLSHCAWEGFSFYDVIMPLFLFMTGAAIPFSLRKYDTSFKSYLRIFRRVLLLFVFGMVVQGGLLSLDVHRFRLYSNTLQAIGAGYFITAIVFLNFKTRGRVAAFALLFAAYWLMLTFGGDFTPDGNFAERVDRAVLGRWRDGVSWSNGEWSFSKNYHYTWIVSSLNFAATVMLGAFAGVIMTGEDKAGNAKKMFALSLALIAAGLLLGLQMPIIKKIWSSSMTLYSGGLCMLAMAFFYYAVDCRGWLKSLAWLKMYGMNSIFAYVVSAVVNFRSIPESLLYGLKPFLLVGGVNYYPLLINFCQYAIIFCLLLFMFRRKIFLKV